MSASLPGPCASLWLAVVYVITSYDCEMYMRPLRLALVPQGSVLSLGHRQPSLRVSQAGLAGAPDARGPQGNSYKAWVDLACAVRHTVPSACVQAGFCRHHVPILTTGATRRPCSSASWAQGFTGYSMHRFYIAERMHVRSGRHRARCHHTRHAAAVHTAQVRVRLLGQRYTQTTVSTPPEQKVVGC